VKLLLIIFMAVAVVCFGAGVAHAGSTEIGDATVDLPAGWQEVPTPALLTLYRSRGDARLIGAFTPASSGSMPFVLVERLNYTSADDRYADIDLEEFFERVSAYYQTPINVPLLTATPGNWQQAAVGPVKWDAASRSFRFYADITFSAHPGAYHVEVVGLFAQDHVLILSTWCDTAIRATDGETLHGIADSFRLTRLESSVRSLKESALHVLKWIVGLAVLTIVAIQVYVLYKERQHREHLRRQMFGDD
jgi:hypothetical protein